MPEVSILLDREVVLSITLNKALMQLITQYNSLDQKQRSAAFCNHWVKQMPKMSTISDDLTIFDFSLLLSVY